VSPLGYDQRPLVSGGPFKIGLIPLAELWILEKDRNLVKQPGGGTMAWKSPKVIEIAVGMEINCYACAEL